MSDLIDRQAAIDLFPNDVLEWDTKDGYVAPHLARRMIEELPSAQPDHNADVGKKVSISCAHENDLISREAVTDALDIAIECYGEIAEKYRKKADIERNDYMDMRDNAYEAQQLAQWLNELKYLREKIEQIIIKPEPHWIPCSERMPEEGQKCLVYDKTIGFRVDTYIGHGNPYNWELFVRDYEAWMPIPKLTGVMLSE